MRVRIALKIFKAVVEYSGWERFDMPYTGKQIYAAAKRLLPVQWRKRYKGWHRVTKEQGIAEVMTILKGGKNDK